MTRTFGMILVAFLLEAATSVPSKLEGGNARLVREFAGSYPEREPRGGRLRSFELKAAPAEVVLIDGRPLRVWAYNGQVPGPVLRVRLGDRVRVRLTNRLPQPTTIHWHGVRVPNEMDGVPHLTQPPVAPGESFVYEFTPKDAGTFWYHPHVRSSEQVERGLYGVLIVEDREKPPYSQDVLWVIDDWLLDGTGQIVEAFNTRHDLAHDGRWGNVITVNGRTDERLRARSGERIRLRMVNVSNGRVHAPDFGALEAKTIAVDGLYLREPIAAKGFELSPGNRLDLDIELREATNASYAVVDRFVARRPNRLATIDVDGRAAPPREFPSPARARVPAWAAGMNEPVDAEFRLNARAGGEHGIEWTINGVAFAGHDHPHEPVMTLRRNRWARLRFVNESARLHPMHLHGMFFRLLARDGRAQDEPFFRDTVLVHPREIIDIGLVPLDEGDWMMHCHILEHAEAGMMTTLRVSG